MFKARFWCLSLIGFLPALADAADGVSVSYAEALLGYQFAATGSQSLHPTNFPAQLRFNAFSRDFVIEVEPNARLATMQARLRLPPGTVAYRGRLAGQANSWVRIVVGPSGPEGLVYDGATLYGIEHTNDFATASHANSPRMFRLEDVRIEPGAIACGTSEANNAQQAYSAMLREFAPMAAAGATLNLDLGAVADFEFFSQFGPDTETALLTRFNNVDGIFSEQVGIQISVAAVDIFDTVDDPFTATDPSVLLDELGTYRGASPTQDALALTHMFTGRNLDGTTVGIAYLGAVCARRARSGTISFGAGLSEGRRGATLDSLVAAHEIGHNFGAPHDAEAGSPCATTDSSFLMAPSISGSDQFSPCSIEQMQPEIASASCLTPIGPADVAVSVNTASLSVGAQQPFDYPITVSNVGIDPATGVTLTVDPQMGLELLGATPDTGTCTITTGVSCDLGTLGGGTARQIAVTLRASSLGTFALTASAGADSDADLSDNIVDASVIANAVVELGLSGNDAPILVLDRQTVLNALVTNSGTFDATSVSVGATLSNGLRPDQASANGTSCSVTGQTITCPSLSMGAGSSIPVSVTVTATATGAQQLSLSAQSAEMDADPSNNQLVLTVNVSGPSVQNGGGGAFSMLALLGLLGATLKRRLALRTGAIPH